MKRILPVLLICWASLCACSRAPYRIRQVEGSRVEMDSTWDAKADPSLVALINYYKSILESKMNKQIGEAAQYLERGFPQSLLTNLTADAMKQYGEEKMGGADFAIVNVHGHRSSLSQGTITIGNMYEVYPFDNVLVLLEMEGKAVLDLFRYYAVNGGEGLSSGVQLIVQNRKIASLKIGGSPIDETKIYRIVSLDYLAAGNDGMEAFKSAIKTTDSGLTLRDVMIEFVKNRTEKHEKINSMLDDRIIVN